MTILIEDSPRNLMAWIVNAHAAGVARGGVLTPFATPRVNKTGRRGADDVAQGLHSEGAEVWFDATTHALQMAGVGDFRYYDEYELWDGVRGDLSTALLREEHVRRVFTVQDELDAPHLGPTVLLHHGESATSQQALELAQAAVDQDPACWLSIAGTAPFWSSGTALDAHVGALAQLEPAGWFLTVARAITTQPVAAGADETEGLCRTSRALSEYAAVHVSHGDLAALPAVAAGADSVGSGWDQRQRVCAYNNYAPRDPGGSGGGGWYTRPTYRGLLGSLTDNEGAVLARRDAALSARLEPPTPGTQEAYMHHLTVLNDIVGGLMGETDYEHRYRRLSASYNAAAVEWPPVVALTGARAGAAEWIDVLAEGLRRYGVSEGW